MKIYIKLILISLFLLVIASCSKSVPVDKSYVNAGIKTLSKPLQAPEFSGKNLNGESIDLSKLKGKVILLNFWASWCGPCVAEMPSLERLSNSVDSDDIIVVAINVGESSEVVSKFIDKGKYTFTVIPDSKKEIATKYAIRSIPSTYIIDKDGMIVASKLGSQEWDSQSVIDILNKLAAK